MSYGWLIERHEKGAIKITPAFDVIERNMSMLKSGEKVMWVVIGSAENMVQAREREVELKRVFREMKDAGNE